MDEPTRSFLEKALTLDSEVVALTIEDRERILWALDDARTDALAELRGVSSTPTLSSRPPTTSVPDQEYQPARVLHLARSDGNKARRRPSAPS
ncbi:MAG TPA: hypothetical protein VFT94_03955 [Gaiellaceae bacterium]|nr:hypothetical protein [Gaiellaceae bacterium]